MKKILFRKLLFDCLKFFIITIISLGIIIWIFQAVNYMDIMIDDGKDYFVYFKFTLLNFPKILSKIFPFALFFSFTYIISKYELNNELVIFWNFGINKLTVVNFFIKYSILIMFIQTFFTAFVSPLSQDHAKSVLRESGINIFDNFIKTKKFNDNIKGLTIYIEDRNQDGVLQNIYLKKQTDNNNFQITFAKSGYFDDKRKSKTLILFDGETLSSSENNISAFKFAQTDYNLTNLESNSSTYIKTQELLSIDLIKCLIHLSNDSKNLNFRKENCDLENLNNINRELYKRFIIPLYIPVLISVSLMLIIHSKEKIDYFKYRIFVFLFGFSILIFSETSLRFIVDENLHNIKILIIPVFLLLALYFYMFYKLNFKHKHK